MTTAIYNKYDITTERVLLMDFELSEKTWKLSFITGYGQKPRERMVTARHQAGLLQKSPKLNDALVCLKPHW